MTVRRCIDCGEYYGTLVRIGKDQYRHEGECPHVVQALAKAKKEGENENKLLRPLR